MQIDFTRHLGALALCTISAIATAASSLAAYPERPIRWIVPGAAGSGVDASARLIANELSEIMGQQIVVDNRGGAGASIGAEIAAKTAPDGYSLLLASSALTINPSLYKKLSYDVIKDFEPVGLAMTTSLVLVASPGSGLKSIADLIATAKAKNDTFNDAFLA